MSSPERALRRPSPARSHRSPRRAVRLPRAVVAGVLVLAAGSLAAAVAVTERPDGTGSGASVAAEPAAAPPAAPAPDSAAGGTGPAVDLAPTGAPSAPEQSAPVAASPTATAPARSAAPATPAAATRPSTAAAPAAADGDAVQQVLAAINRARADQGLPAYTLTTGLTTSATAHSQVMADGCGLSHRCAGEAALGARESTAGVHWGAAGENIGTGGPAGSAPASAAMAVRLTQDMLAERPPEDGHRRNILSSKFTHVGISVLRDGSGTVWMTQDFSD
ncbi:CAP domain-containing protein [Kitasatospora sp. NPDC088346]|uniref:CAP domain-containing protein n=1 Tax=Kitasatospora sp. NPDC088346 TaxID=3364073 RepID=UPI0038195CC4